jgi:hypothetical protein
MVKGLPDIQFYEGVCEGLNLGKHPVGIGEDPGSNPREHQKSLTIGPFDNICEADAVSPEVAIGGLQDIVVYNERDIKWIRYKKNTSFIYHLPTRSTSHN